MLHRRQTIGRLTVAMLFAGSLALSGATPELQAPRAVAQIEVRPTRVDWLPKAGDYERLVLTVAGPGDFYVQREFGPGEAPSFSSFDARGSRLSDGVYAYELRAVSRQDLKFIERPRVQSGHLWLHEGSFDDKLPALPVPSRQRGSASKLPNVTTKDIVQADDLIVQGQACVGADCVNGDADEAGVVLRLKETFGGQLRFQGLNCCHPSTRIWALQANDLGATNGDFLIRDLTAATIPFRIGAGAPENALTVFFNGNVGLGTLTPANRLHVFGSAGTNKALIQEASGAAASRELLELRNNGGTALILEDTSVAQRWAASTLGANFLINEQANAGTEFTLTNTGNLTISGVLTQGSSRDLKTDFVSLDPQDVLAKVKALPVSVWRYKLDGPEVRHVGPMAEDFHKAFGLGGDDKRIAPSDQAGVALVAVQGLTQEIETLRSKNAGLEERIALLEALIASLKPQE